MAMPQQDDYIEQIHRLEGLMAYAGRDEIGEWRSDDEITELVGLSMDVSKLINGLILSLRKSSIGGMRSNRA